MTFEVPLIIGAPEIDLGTKEAGINIKSIVDTR
jgi:hypothetical protein